MAGVGRTLVAPLMGYPGLKLTGATVAQALRDANAQFETLDALGRTFSPDVLFCFMDLTAEAEAVGAEVAFSENQPPSIVGHCSSVEQCLRECRVPDPETQGRLPVFIRTMEQMKRHLQIIRGAYVTGPLTLAGEIAGVKNVMKGMIKEGRLVRGLLRFTTEVIKRYARCLVEVGADLICILEPSVALVSPTHYLQFSKDAVEEVASSVRSIILLHVCGDVTPLIPEMIKTRVHGISIDSGVDMEGVFHQREGRMAVAGNIDPIGEMVFSTPERIRKRVVELRAKAQRYERALVSPCHPKLEQGDESRQGIHSNFILSTGCDLPPEVPLENIAAFMEGGREPILRQQCQR